MNANAHYRQKATSYVRSATVRLCSRLSFRWDMHVGYSCKVTPSCYRMHVGYLCKVTLSCYRMHVGYSCKVTPSRYRMHVGNQLKLFPHKLVAQCSDTSKMCPRGTYSNLRLGTAIYDWFCASFLSHFK
jgi:hypothetical protein